MHPSYPSHTFPVVHPDLPVALTHDRGEGRLVQWDLRGDQPRATRWPAPPAPAVEGPFSGLAATTLAWTDLSEAHDYKRHVLLGDWSDPSRAARLPERLADPLGLETAALSPKGRLLAVSGCEDLTIIDLDQGLPTATEDDFRAPEDGRDALGDWAVEPRFSPDGSLLAVANTMQGSWWTLLADIADDGAATTRWLRMGGFHGPDHLDDGEGYPELDGGGPQITTDISFAPDASAFAVWVRPDHGREVGDGYRGRAVLIDVAGGDLVWHQPLHLPELAAGAGSPQAYSAPLCFTDAGTHLAVGVDDGVHWYRAADGAPAGYSPLPGGVRGLVCDHHGSGMLAAGSDGLVRVAPPA